jgi:hypothetical protein
VSEACRYRTLRALPRDYDVNRGEGLVDLEALDRPNVPVGALERLTILLVTVRPT